MASAQSATTIPVAPEPSSRGRASSAEAPSTTVTRVHPPSASARTPRTSHGSPSSARTRALGIPIRLPAPAASSSPCIAPCISGGERLGEDRRELVAVRRREAAQAHLAAARRDQVALPGAELHPGGHLLHLLARRGDHDGVGRLTGVPVRRLERDLVADDP